MCNVNDPRILNAYIAITEDETTDWLLLGYKDSRDVISLYACGEHGLSEFRANITNEILFGFVRVEEKFILITYIPDSISGVRRARALVHSRTVAGILELSHAQIIASSLSDLSDNNVRTRLKLEPVARPKSRSSFIHQQRRRRSGSSYYSPSPSPVTFITDDEDTLSDRMSATPTPSTPTSSVHSEQQHYFPTVLESTSFFVEEPKRLQDNTESMLQAQLAKKKELEEARFKLFHKEQKPNIAKRIEEEQKRIKQQQPQKEIPKWQLELKQRKLKKQESMMAEKQKPSSINIDTANLQRYQTMPVSKIEHVSLKEVKKEPVRQVLNEAKIEPIKQPLKPVKVELIKPTLKVEETKSFDKEPIKQLSTVTKASVMKEPVQQVTTELQVTELEIKEKPKTVSIQPLIPLMEGFVSVQINQSPFWKRRYYVLNSQKLSFHKDEFTKKSLYEIALNEILRVSRIDEDEEVFVPNSFMIETNQQELYQILADDKKEYTKLYTTLKHSISK